METCCEVSTRDQPSMTSFYRLVSEFCGFQKSGFRWFKTTFWLEKYQQASLIILSIPAKNIINSKSGLFNADHIITLIV
jgi:hypothetical protein